MKAVVISAYGGPELLREVDVGEPEGGPGRIVVRQTYAGVNFADVYMRQGLYNGQHTYRTALPFIPGVEGAGEVVSSGAPGFATGDRVAYCLGNACYAETIVVDAAKAVLLPSGIGDEIAAAVILQGSTAHYLTHSLFPLAPGQSCLIHAAAGGVGQILVQLAKTRGAFVIATAGGDDKVDFVRGLGADLVIDYRRDCFAEAVHQATSGRGVDVVYDSVGRDTISRSLRCLKVRGTCVLFGASSGTVNNIVPMELAECGSVFFTRPHLAHYRRTAKESQSRMDDLFSLLRSGTLKQTIDKIFPLDAAAEAHRRLEKRASRGKILLSTRG
ncbi:zinc-binding dehydrogenase [Aquicoccus sp. SCR17]|nr:zinc-binding dehydrogenase [Carideicomes alvinocaridis]